MQHNYFLLHWLLWLHRCLYSLEVAHQIYYQIHMLLYILPFTIKQWITILKPNKKISKLFSQQLPNKKKFIKVPCFCKSQWHASSSEHLQDLQHKQIHQQASLYTKSQQDRINYKYLLLNFLKYQKNSIGLKITIMPFIIFIS